MISPPAQKAFPPAPFISIIDTFDLGEHQSYKYGQSEQSITAATASKTSRLHQYQFIKRPK